MKLQDQVCTLEQAKRLNELGVGIFPDHEIVGARKDQQATFYWRGNMAQPYPGCPYEEAFDEVIFMKGINRFEYLAAWTVAELGVMLPSRALHPCYTMPGGHNGKGKGSATGVWQTGEVPTVWATRHRMDADTSYHASEAEARAALLIRLLEEGNITASEVNSRLQ